MPRMSESDRFAFGENWKSFLETLDEERVGKAIDSLCSMLSSDSLSGKTFLDIGSGSGLFSLAASRLGANVVSIDYDAESVACTAELRRRFDVDPATWKIERGSVLDESLIDSLGQFDVVYSWGVLHHTGDMSRAMNLAGRPVREGGQLFIAIYNDQGAASRRWLRIKQTYNRLPVWLRPAWVTLVAGYYECKFALSRLSRGKNPLPFRDWRAKKADRGMSAWHDWVDWIGGLPFEVSTTKAVIDEYSARGFEIEKLSEIGKGWGCNEFVFRRGPVAE